MNFLKKFITFFLQHNTVRCVHRFSMRAKITQLSARFYIITCAEINEGQLYLSRD